MGSFKMSKLVVFVHGLGADDYDWWGSTKHLLTGKYANDQDTDFLFYRYKTDKTSGIQNKFKLFFGYGTMLADFDGLGGLLLSEINNFIIRQDKHYEEIKLFGHSMGGIVIASCIYKMKVQNDPLYSNVTSIALCGTPLGGSKIAARVDSLFPFQTSSHTKLLRYGNRELKRIVNNFSSIVSVYYEESKPQLTFFKIEDDEVVKTDEEKFGSYDKDDIEALSYSMSGGHVSAVQNLENNNPNFGQIIKWIEKDNISRGIPDDKIENFEQFISNRGFSQKKGIMKIQLKKKYLEYIQSPSRDSDGFEKRPYIDLSINARKTYLKPNEDQCLSIIDFRRTIKIIESNRDCEFEFTNGFLKESKYAHDDELKKIIDDLSDQQRASRVDRFKNNVLNVAYKLNGNETLYPLKKGICGDDEPLKILDNYETDKSKGIRIICNLGSNFSVGDEIELLVSLTLPTNIWEHPSETDTFSFPISTIERKYVVQEEIYGENTPKLQPSVKDNADIVENNDRSLYYERYIFTEKRGMDFKTIEISYRHTS